MPEDAVGVLVVDDQPPFRGVAAAVVACSTYPVDELPAEVATATFAEYVHKAQLRPEVLRRAWARAQPR
jgi:hypothetical protein